MHLDWSQFTPWSALLGGALIGLAAALYLLGNGRVAGIAGLVGTPLLALARGAGLGSQRVRLWFLLGLLAAPWLWQTFAALPPMRVDAGLGVLLAAGGLVGVGSRMANGCTSGHGVCGLSRFSRRSAVNVAVFMASGFVTVFVVRHVF